MWSDGLSGWYAESGRHHLPWRGTRDPWAVLVSEVMLQQTSVARVLPRWQAFLDRWPTPSACAATPLEEVLRAWDGLGYPRRARALHGAAVVIAQHGWPVDEAGLRKLPGVGSYTARALLTLAFGSPSAAPRDVNISRVTARAALDVEPHQAPASRLDATLATAPPAAMSRRDLTLALFDLGATVCRARRPQCQRCPLQRCASRQRLAAAPPAPPPRRQGPYQGSLRQLRGAVLRAMLGDDPPRTAAALRARVESALPTVDPRRLDEAVTGLRAEGLLPRGCPTMRRSWPPSPPT